MTAVYSRKRHIGAAAALLTLGACLFSGTASAQAVDARAILADPNVQAAIEACREDRDKLCPRVQPGGGRIVRCLLDQAQLLAPKCAAGMRGAKASLEKAGIQLPGRLR